jgi:hypothetical protein
MEVPVKASTRSETFHLAIASLLIGAHASACLGACAPSEISPEEAKSIILQHPVGTEATPTFADLQLNTEHPRFYLFELRTETGPGHRVTHLGNGLLGRFFVSKATGAIWLVNESSYSSMDGREPTRLQAEIRRKHCIGLDLVTKEEKPGAR